MQWQKLTKEIVFEWDWIVQIVFVHNKIRKYLSVAWPVHLPYFSSLKSFILKARPESMCGLYGRLLETSWRAKAGTLRMCGASRDTETALGTMGNVV